MDVRNSRLTLLLACLAGSSLPVHAAAPATLTLDNSAVVTWKQGGAALSATAGVAIDILRAYPDVRIRKSAAVRDPLGGSLPVPGAEITFRLHAKNHGALPAHDVIVTDPVPARTRYKASSLRLDGQSLTDADDGDSARFNAEANAIEIRLDAIDPGAEHRIEFTVRINQGDTP